MREWSTNPAIVYSEQHSSENGSEGMSHEVIGKKLISVISGTHDPQCKCETKRRHETKHSVPLMEVKITIGEADVRRGAEKLES